VGILQPLWYPPILGATYIHDRLALIRLALITR
jgi:hypothetical protein